MLLSKHPDFAEVSVFEKGEKLEKNPQSKVRTNNKLKPQRKASMNLGHRGRRRALIHCDNDAPHIIIGKHPQNLVQESMSYMTNIISLLYLMCSPVISLVSLVFSYCELVFSCIFLVFIQFLLHSIVFPCIPECWYFLPSHILMCLVIFVSFPCIPYVETPGRIGQYRGNKGIEGSTGPTEEYRKNRRISGNTRN